MRQWFQTFRNRLELWLLSKLVVAAFERLEAQHLGQKLNAMMDLKISKEKSDIVQLQLATWLTQVAKELSS